MTSRQPLELSPLGPEPLSEPLLLAAARDGSDGAVGILYARHRHAAVVGAERALGADLAWLAEDVVEAAFFNVVRALRNGNGPDDQLRPYLLTAVRHEAWRAMRVRGREGQAADRMGEARTEVVEGADALDVHVLLREAFGALPEAWRTVLWLTEVEGRRPADVAELTGGSARATAALAYRARRGLITAYVGAYLARRNDPSCRAIAPRLGEFLAAGRRSAPVGEGFDDVEAHLEDCPDCRDLSRGVDLGATALALLGPAALILAARTALGASTGAAPVVGGASGAPAAGGAGASAGGGAVGAGPGVGAAAGAGGVGAGVAAAAAAVVAGVVIAGAAIAGVVGAGSERSGAQLGAPASSVPVEAERPSVQREDVSESALPGVLGVEPGPEAAEPAVGPDPAPDGAGSRSERSADAGWTADGAPAEPPPAEPVPAPSPPPSTPTTSVPTTAPSTTSVPTTTPVTTTSVPTTTTTTTTPPSGGELLGAAVLVEGGVDVDPASLGIVITAVHLRSGSEHRASLRADGAWQLGGLDSGLYLVTAEVPARFAPVRGADPWLGGDTWTTVLALVVVDGSRRQVDPLELRVR